MPCVNLFSLNRCMIAFAETMPPKKEDSYLDASFDSFVSLCVSIIFWKAKYYNTDASPLFTAM